ncbi:MAG: holo-[acyl-carrier protein] synthase [Acidimicrobiaceae bacterium]|nr:holo-[acyl-carrier protein] synthase [Acidimicrobiaceae bacterium]
MIGIGIDAVDVERFRRLLARRPGLADRLFTAGEQSVGSGVAGLAARFAAKEAAMKALGVGLGAFRFHDVEVVRLEGGAPTLRVTGAAEALATALGVRTWLVSLTHTSTMAEAVVVAE